jgi:chromosome segregation ATPase
MLQVARTEHNDVIKDYDSTSKELTHQINYKNIVTKQLEDKKIENDNRIDRYKSDIEKKSKKISLLESQITEPNLELVSTIKQKKEAFDVNIEEVENSIETDLHKRMQYEAEIKMFKKTLSEIGTDKAKCPVCLHEISSDDRDHIESEKSKISNDIKDREQDIEDINLQVGNLKQRKKTYITEQDKCKSYLKDVLAGVESNKRIKLTIGEIKEEILELEKEISTIENTTDNTTELEKQIEGYSNQVITLENDVERLSRSNKILEFVKYVLSEEGVKSYIVKKILNILNNRLLYYLDKMDANCVCKFNEFFEEEIKNDKGQECSYFNFSGSERKNIDLACLFTFMDIRRMQGDVSYNLVMFDELLDSSLDEKGVELVLSILKERVDQYKEGIYIISHRKESAKESSGEVIYLEKTNGITRRVNYNN